VLALQRLKEAAEKAKHELSTTTEQKSIFRLSHQQQAGPQHLLLKMTRSGLEQLANEYVTRSIEISKTCN
jgi:molecular chaperone DnaK